MNTQREINDFFNTGYKRYVPHVSIDCAIFGYHERQLKILLINIKSVEGMCLPGGYIKRTETLTEAAGRIVEERTGIKNLFLQQFKTFGDPGRATVRGMDEKKLSKIFGVRIEKNNWIMDQTISIGFYAITDFSQVKPKPDFMSEFCKWYDIDQLPHLLFDHDEMVKEALHTMRLQLYHYPIGINLLPEKFTLTEIHALYETLLGKKLDIRNFPKKLMFLGVIKKLNEKINIGPHRSPFLYKFDKVKYNKALKEGIILD
ncbi:MAG: NUDIX hydrolase [Bacteroidetes bacterium]|nr:NUDIX hydrolase [Bacteroidota bacterium]